MPISIKWKCLFLLLWFGSYNSFLRGQDQQRQQLIEFYFVKSSDNFENKGHYFNALKIINRDSVKHTVQPKLRLPKGWKIAPYLDLPARKTVAALDSAFIPIKLIVPKFEQGGTDYTLQMDAWDEINHFLGSTIATVALHQTHNWSVEVLEQEVFIPVDSSEMRFKTSLQNRGNVDEKIHLSYRFNGAVEHQHLELKAGQDTLIELHSVYKTPLHTSPSGVRREPIQLTATNGSEVKNTTFYLIKSQHHFDGLQASGRANSVAFTTDHIPTSNINNAGIRATGRLPIRKKTEFSYFLMNNDLLNDGNIERSTVYRLEYLSPALDVGLGSTFDYGFRLHRINTVSGRRPTINGFNGLNVTWRPLQTDRQKVTIFVNRNVRQPVTTVLAAHQLQVQRTSLESAFSYTVDYFGKKSIKIFAFQWQQPIKNNHYFELSLNAAEEVHHLQSYGDPSIDSLYKYDQTILRDGSFNYQLFYSGFWTKGLTVSVNNTYSSVRYPNQERGVFNLDARFSYRFPHNRHAIFFNYRYQAKNPLTYADRFRLPLYGFQRENILIEYQMPINGVTLLRGGAFIQDFRSQRPILNTANLNDFVTVSYRIFIGLEHPIKDKTLRAELVHGKVWVQDFIGTDGLFYNGISEVPTLDFRLEYGNAQQRFGMNYLKGPNATLGQVGTQFQLSELGVVRFFGIQNRYFLNQRLRLANAFSWELQSGNNRGLMAITPQVEVFLGKGWSVELMTIFNYIFYKTGHSWAGQDMTRFRTALKYNFYTSLQSKFYDLTALCFYDENSNGEYDADEILLPEVELTLRPALLRKRSKTEPVYATLFSNQLGEVIFAKIPTGEYRLTVGEIRSQNALTTTFSEETVIKIEGHKKVFIPFNKANSVIGKLTFKKAKFSTQTLDLGNIRVSATDEKGTFVTAVLTDSEGQFVLILPENGRYTISISNPFDEKITLKERSQVVDFQGVKEIYMNFELIEKTKKVNFD